MVVASGSKDSFAGENLKDKGLDNLPDRCVVAEEIDEHLESASGSFQKIIAQLKKEKNFTGAKKQHRTTAYENI